MDAKIAVIVVLLAALAALAALYLQASSAASSLSSQLAESRQTIAQLRAKIYQLQSEIEQLNQTLALRKSTAPPSIAPRGYVYSLIKNNGNYYIYVIDPLNNNIVAVVDLRRALDLETYSLLSSAKVVESWIPRYYVPDTPYLFLLFEGLNGSYVLILNRSDLSEVKLIKTSNSFTRQYAGITPDGRYLLIAQRAPRDLVVIDLSALEIADTIPLAADPCDVAPSPDGRYVLMPLRADKNASLPELALVMSVPSGRAVATYYLKQPGQAESLEPSMTYWPFRSPGYGLLQFEGGPREVVLSINATGGALAPVKEVTYPSVAFMAVEDPAEPLVVVVVSGFGLYVRSEPPSYGVLDRVELVPRYLKSAVMGVFSQDGRFFYVAGPGGLVVVNASSWSVAKYIRADSAVWVLAVPGGDWLASAQYRR
ncbi:hypothetical protein TUZN_1102 [Thermoproteus uzoniensis 768-20]|uniref:Uncharacterized protein n=1 Tax=Thermoproteus uzoniensis (strain 768-20) TaxID=999630 RepID=F2L0A0_THEU7|nr:hypothetical protein [Thermoproteus uzoniensis]AEA12582.1 hypothetical protein TUZN_1102 [Thermoproteus uzoniensis 768-20]